MRQDRVGGLALIGGTLAGMVTMASHPTGHALMRDFERTAAINRGVHALAIAGTIVTLYGLVRLSRQFDRGQSLADAALVSYGLGAVAVIFAAIASGFIATDIAAEMLQAGEGGVAAFEPIRAYNWAFNQACTRVFVVTASAGIALWSLAMLRESGFSRGLAITGLVASAAAAIATIAGLPMNMHGFGAIVLAHGLWQVWAGVSLGQRPMA